MTERVLLISSDAEWRAALGDELGLADIAVLSCAADDDRRLRSFTARDCAAAVIRGEPDTEPGAGRYGVVARLAKRIRDAGRRYPILFAAVVPDDELAVIARHYEPSAVVQDQSLAMDWVDVLRAEWGRLQSDAPIAPAASATIEITLGATEIGLVARVGKDIVDRRPPQEWSSGRFNIHLLNEEFRDYDVDPDTFRRVWQKRLNSASKSLWHNIIETPGFRSSLDLVKSRINMDFSSIHFRFIVANDDLEYVPFEVAGYGSGADEYIRYVAPLGRKLLLDSTRVLADPEQVKFVERRNQPIVLFFSAAVDGHLTVEGKTFKGEKAPKLRKLSHISKESEAVFAVHGSERVCEIDLAKAADPVAAVTTALQQGPWEVIHIDLAKAADPVAAMTAALQQGPWDVIHFAGHSIQADQDRQVFLALPDRGFPGQLKGYSADDFARRAAQAGARLVVLSSCESCSCRSLLKMASFGVPAVVGFRWPVDDNDAASFTPDLHKALYQQKFSLMRAFQDAVFKLKETAGGRITPFSPILLIQPDSWQNYWLEE